VIRDSLLTQHGREDDHEWLRRFVAYPDAQAHPHQTFHSHQHQARSGSLAKASGNGISDVGGGTFGSTPAVAWTAASLRNTAPLAL